MHIYTLKRCIL